MIANQETLCKIINQIHSIESKLMTDEKNASLKRKFERIRGHFEELNIVIHNPKGEAYSETRLDCEASISGDQTDNLEIIEVLKPVVFLKDGEFKEIIQRGVVIAEGK